MERGYVFRNRLVFRFCDGRSLIPYRQSGIGTSVHSSEKSAAVDDDDGICVICNISVGHAPGGDIQRIGCSYIDGL